MSFGGEPGQGEKAWKLWKDRFERATRWMTITNEDKLDLLLLMRGSILPVTISPPGTPPGICALDVLFPTPGHTERDNSPPPGLMTWTKNKLLRFDDLFLYLNKTRNLKNPKLLERTRIHI